MNKLALMNLSSLALVTLLTGCGIGAAIRNDDRYMQPGALDMPLTGIYSTYQFRLLDKYRVTHQWLNSSGCRYSAIEQPSQIPGRRTLFYVAGDIYEEDGITKQRGAHPAFDLNRFVRSVKHQRPIYAPTTKEESEASVAATLERARRSSRTGIYENPPPDKREPIRHEEIEIGFRALCFESWWVPSHLLKVMLYKRDLASWRVMLTEKNPRGVWSERRVGANLWLVQETAEQDFGPRPLNGVGGPFQVWLLPIGDTGYTIGMELGASRESLQHPDAHTRIQDTLRHLIESVKIEPL